MLDFPGRHAARYAPYYCEENVYWLARNDPRRTDAMAVFISNVSRTVALCSQRIGSGENRLVVWDYHVIYLRDGRVFDLDSTLSFPCSAEIYEASELSRTLMPSFTQVHTSECIGVDS